MSMTHRTDRTRASTTAALALCLAAAAAVPAGAAQRVVLGEYFTNLY
jgi:carbohydrate-selective porin OprB